jgi:hypothetical protein
VWKPFLATVAAIIVSACISISAVIALNTACSRGPLHDDLDVEHVEPYRAKHWAKGPDKSQHKADENKYAPAVYSPIAYVGEGQIERRHAEAAEAYPNWEKREWWNGFICDVKATDVAIAFFTLFLVAIGALQGVYIRRSVKVSERALTELERAYIYIKSIESNVRLFLRQNLPWPINPKPIFIFTLVNHGKTSGNFEEGIICFQVLKGMPTEADLIRHNERVKAEPDPDAASVEIIVGPGKKYPLPPLGTSEEFTIENANNIIAGTAFLYCHGWYRYIDIFMKPHTAVFCRKYIVKTHEFQPAGGKERNHYD